MSEITEIFRARSNVHDDPNRHSCHAAHAFSNGLAVTHHVQTIVMRRNVFGGRFDVVFYFPPARLRFKSSINLDVSLIEVDSTETPDHLNCKRIIYLFPKVHTGPDSFSTELHTYVPLADFASVRDNFPKRSARPQSNFPVRAFPVHALSIYTFIKRLLFVVSMHSAQSQYPQHASALSSCIPGMHRGG
jgi:hypothetical protein